MAVPMHQETKYAKSCEYQPWKLEPPCNSNQIPENIKIIYCYSYTNVITKRTVDAEVLEHGCRNLLFPFALLVMFAKNECCVSKHMAMLVFSMNGICKYTYLQAAAQIVYLKTCACVCLC